MERLEGVEDTFPPQGEIFNLLSILQCRRNFVVNLLVPQAMVDVTIAATQILVVDGTKSADMSSIKSSIKHSKVVKL
jgi:hypothetical protein